MLRHISVCSPTFMTSLAALSLPALSTNSLQKCRGLLLDVLTVGLLNEFIKCFLVALTTQMALFTHP